MHPHLPDYGWRFHGKPVTVLRDHSNDAMQSVPPVKIESAVDKESHRTCLQCGVCTASCGLAKDGDLFPRREMSLVQSGLFAKAAAMPTIWQCFQCNDCSEGCPSTAKPSEVMAELRRRAVEAFAAPRVAAEWANHPLPFALIAITSAAPIALLSVLFGTPFPEGREAVFRRMFPHGAIIAFFGVTVLVSAAVMLGSLKRIWNAWVGGTDDAISTRAVIKGSIRAFLDTVLHRRFSKCERRRFSGVPHAAVIAGFVGLSIMAGIAAVLHFFGGGMDFPMSSPFKISANIFAVMLLSGLGSFFFARLKKHKEGSFGSFFDWAFLSNLLVVTLSGFGSQWLRVTEFASAAYAVYSLHLTSVFLFLALLPYTKLAHAVYRFAAEVLRESREISADDEKIVQFAAGVLREAHRANTSEANPTTDVIPSDTSLLQLSPSDLSALSDDTLIDGYNRIRDKAESDEERAYYPGIQHLFNTPFEREKDSRETALLVSAHEKSEMQHWYEHAAEQSCVWWLENHLLIKHSLKSCMFCGMCTSVCPAAEYFPSYNPRSIVDVALSKDEASVSSLLKSEVIWYCGQCGSCKERCTRSNSVMGIISSMRQLAEIKGFHLSTARGRQQYAGRHLWGTNFWNRGCSLYFRNADASGHPDFGPAYQQFFETQDEEFLRVGAHPDRDGVFGGRKIRPESLEELRRCALAGGSLFLWNRIDLHAGSDAAAHGIDRETYLATVRKEG